MYQSSLRAMGAALVLLLFVLPAASAQSPDLWTLANSKKQIHRFSTLIPAEQVKQYLSTEAGVEAAIDWCKKTAITKVYIETFRGDYQAERDTLVRAKERFQKGGIEVSGCVTTTRIGKSSQGWTDICCYTDVKTQEHVQAVFEFAASIFDEIMIDDFWFTDCKCAECDAARLAKKVTVGEKTFPVSGDTWEDYRCELMVRVSQERILAAAKRVNPKAKVIIKYPQWYEDFHNRGYEVIRETADFDRIFVGTETRDYADKRWGGTVQYEGFVIMRWLGGIGGEKCGGGWYDPYGTTPPTYIEQARQTILGGARESLLFCYGALQQGGGRRDVEALRTQIPELFDVAAEVSKRKIVGVAAYKPANSHAGKEQKVFDFVGMMGIPLVPCHEFPSDAPAAFFSVHALKDAEFATKLKAFIAAGKPVLLTDGLVARLGEAVDLKAANVRVLPVKGDPKSLLSWSDEQVNDVRDFVMRPLSVRLKAPNKVGFYLFADGSSVVENFNDAPAQVSVEGRALEVGPRGWSLNWK